MAEGDQVLRVRLQLDPGLLLLCGHRLLLLAARPVPSAQVHIHEA